MLTMEAKMSRPRMSMSGLMLLVVFVAVGSAALCNSSAAWAGGMLLATLGMLGMSIFGLIYRSGGDRAWWLGCALFGSGYLAAASSPALRPKLPTTGLLDYAYTQLKDTGRQGRVLRLTSTGTGSVRLVSDAGSTLEADEIRVTGNLSEAFGRTRFIAATGVPEHFLDAGHCVFTWLAALVGALAARWFQATREATAQDL
jgi:hypothetical protein